MNFENNSNKSIGKVKQTLKDKELQLKMLKIQIDWSIKNKVILKNDVQQFISLPRAIANADETPCIKNDKSKGLHFFKEI